ncbi:hypothetical protein L1887_23380 [Cichorium endivia]|nr:hypothetical protein L1887_23380 [Cichorium endivia]
MSSQPPETAATTVKQYFFQHLEALRRLNLEPTPVDEREDESEPENEPSEEHAASPMEVHGKVSTNM